MKTANEWREECNYIAHQTDTVGAHGVRRCERNPSFGHDKQCFLDYCVMQRECAERDGVPDAAQYIQHCIDDLQGQTPLL